MEIKLPEDIAPLYCPVPLRVFNVDPHTSSVPMFRASPRVAFAYYGPKGTVGIAYGGFEYHAWPWCCGASIAVLGTLSSSYAGRLGWDSWDSMNRLKIYGAWSMYMNDVHTIVSNLQKYGPDVPETLPSANDVPFPVLNWLTGKRSYTERQAYAVLLRAVQGALIATVGANYPSCLAMDVRHGALSCIFNIEPGVYTVNPVFREGRHPIEIQVHEAISPIQKKQPIPLFNNNLFGLKGGATLGTSRIRVTQCERDMYDRRSLAPRYLPDAAIPEYNRMIALPGPKEYAYAPLVKYLNTHGPKANESEGEEWVVEHDADGNL